MSFDYDAASDDENTSQSKGGGLRAQLEEALAEMKRLKDENSTLTSKVKQSDLASLLADRKVPANVQKWIKASGIDPTESAVDKWIADNAADFGWNPNATASTEKPEDEQSDVQEAPAVQQSVLTPEDIAALQRVQQLQAAGNGQFTASDQAEQAVEAAASQALKGDRDDFDRLMAAFREQGIPIESAFG